MSARGVPALRRAEWLWTACGGAFVLLVVWFSLTPDPPRAPTVDEFKTGHIAAYLWLMLWFAQVVRSAGRRAVVALLLCGLGVALEYAQRLTPHRTFSYSDMVDDMVGVAASYILAFTPLGRVLPALLGRVGK